MEAQEEAAILYNGIRILEGIAGQRPAGYRSPSWELSEHSLDLLAERGFLYDSSLMGDDAPYYVHQPILNRLGPMASPQEVYNAWQWEFDGAY